MNKKGFTLVEMIVVIILTAIVLGIATLSYDKFLKSGRDKSFKLLENSIEDAILSAYTDCMATSSNSNFCTNHSMPSVNGTDTIRLIDLINGGYLDNIKNPYNKNEYCSNEGSYVIVSRKNVNIRHDNETINTEDTDISFKTCLVCGNKRSDGC